jgi:SAM-dependent methyltransferase
MLHVEPRVRFYHQECPACRKSGSFSALLTCRDYTVSGEEFAIVSCSNCLLKFTNPVPSPENLGDYYKAEEYISHSDTKKGLIATLYHRVRKRALAGKLRLVERYVSRGTILDYGCGTGAFLRYARSRGWDAYGVEPDAGARNIAGDGVTSDIANLSDGHPGRTFNVITLWHVLEHVFDLNELLGKLYAMLHKSGILVIAVPNHTSFDAKHYGPFWAAYDVPRHLYHFSPETIGSTVERHGFHLDKMYPMKFDSYYVSLLSEKYKYGHTRYFSAFLTGLKSNLAAKSADRYSSVIYVFRK